jgi:ligand-binding sensor domain-containing protein
MIWFIPLGYSLSVTAQQPVQTGVPQEAFHFHKLTQEVGLSSYNVEKIIQDEYGYTWMATQDGLDRFDGKTITIYNQSLEPARQLVNNDIWDLAEDTANHRLWVATYTGLNCIDLATGKVLPPEGNLDRLLQYGPNGWFKCLLLCGRRLWIGTHNQLKVYDLDKHALDPIQPLPASLTDPGAGNNVDHCWRDEYGRVWVFVANYGIVIYSGASGRVLQSHPLAELGMEYEADKDRFRSMASLGHGRLALVTNNGMFDVRYDLYTFAMKPMALPGKAASLNRKEMYYCATDSAGLLWFGADNGLYRYDPATGAMLEIRDDDYTNPENWFSGIFCIYFDRYSHLWLGTQKGTAFTIPRPSPFDSYFQSADYHVTINHANGVFPYQDSLLFVCAEDGFYRVNMRTHLIRQLDTGRFFNGGLLTDGNLLVSKEKRLLVLHNGKLVGAETVYPEFAPIRIEPIIGLTWCGDTLALMASNAEHGVFCWYPRRHGLCAITTQSAPLTLGSDVVNRIYLDHRRRLWVLSDAGCSIYDPVTGKMDTFHLDDPYTHRPATFYFDVAEARGMYWLGIYGTGVLGLDSNLRLRQSFSYKEGLANTGVYKVLPWKDSLLFVTTNNGLARIRLKTSSVTNYFRADGLHGNGFEEASGYFDGRYIYAGGLRGVSRIEPSLIPPDPVPPPLRIGNIRLQTSSTVYDIGDVSASTLAVPPEAVRATMTVFTFNYTDNRRILLFYRIPELNTQWILLGADQTIDLLGLSPGTYTLLVKAVHSDGATPERRISLTIDWLPKWYQTLLFKIFAGLLVFSLLYLFYRYRINNIRQQQLIRQNISSDLHDDIGSILNTIKIFTHLARKGPEADGWLAQIETSLGQAAVAVRDMIWVLDDSRDTVYELLERIRQFALPVTTANGIKLEVSADGPIDLSLAKDEKRNLLLVAKESINNSIKYASCARIVVRVESVGKSISLHIEDDGAGFDLARPTEGNGLKNICRRAEKIRYTFTIDTAPGAGTRVILTKEQVKANRLTGIRSTGKTP